MKDSLIPGLLRDYRKAKGLSTTEVIQALNAKGISIAEKTLYGYENGTSTPNVRTFIALCDIYDINDIKRTFSGNGISPFKANLSSDDWHITFYNDFFNGSLLEKVYLLLKYGVPTFSGYEDRLKNEFPSDSERANFERLYNSFKKLNEIQQGIAIGRIEEMASQEENLKPEFKEKPTCSGAEKSS